MADRIVVGDVYEDCDYHLVLCLSSEDGVLSGISLVDGSYPRQCDERHCDPRRVPASFVMEIRKNYAHWRSARIREDAGTS